MVSPISKRGKSEQLFRGDSKGNPVRIRDSTRCCESVSVAFDDKRRSNPFVYERAMVSAIKTIGVNTLRRCRRQG